MNTGCDTLIVDTAGRLALDAELMQEMRGLKGLLNPQEILFVADAMTGQDAVHSAGEFHKQLALTGTVLTKMDGDARGGAALSIRHVTGQPVKFIGTGEKSDAFEPFHPDRIVSRILGMGDMMTLIERAEETLDKKKQEDFARKALSGDGFSLEDFRDQLRRSASWARCRAFSRCCRQSALFRVSSRWPGRWMKGSLTGSRPSSIR